MLCRRSRKSRSRRLSPTGSGAQVKKPESVPIRAPRVVRNRTRLFYARWRGQMMLANVPRSSK